MSVPIALLGLLDREPSHGYDLKREYDAYFGRSRPLPFGQVYSTLSRLARDGKVLAGDAEPGSGPDRKTYVITEAGRREVDAWLSEPVEPEPHLQTVLFTKVVLALMLGRPAEQYLDAQRVTHLHRMRDLTELKRTGTVADALLADHALFHLEADLRWLDATSSRLAGLAEMVRAEEARDETASLPDAEPAPAPTATPDPTANPRQPNQAISPKRHQPGRVQNQ